MIQHQSYQSVHSEDEVLPSNEGYELPEGVQWSKVYKSVLSHGLFYFDCSLYISFPLADEQTGFKRVANFEIHILQHMLDEEISMRLVKIENRFGASHTFECPSMSFKSVSNFKELVESKGNFHFKGTAAQYERLKGFLMDEMGSGRMIDVMGWQPEGFFAFNNLACNGSLIPYNEQGCFLYKDVQYYVPSANEIYRKSDHKHQNQKLVQYFDTKLTWREWSHQMVKVHGPHAMTAITWGLACSIRDLIFDKEGFFPVLFFYGEPSSGKGNLAKAIMALFGKPQPVLNISGKANTDKGKIRKLAQMRNMALLFDEFINQMPPDMMEMIKGLWEGYGYERGNIQSRYSTDTVPINSGVMMAGNEYPVNEALLTRLIIEEMHKNQFQADEKKEFDKLKAMIQDGYSGMLSKVFGLRGKLQKEYHKINRSVKDEFEVLFFGYDLPSRMISNAAVLGTVYRFFGPLLDLDFTWEDFTGHLKAILVRQNMKRDSGGDVAKFWDVFIYGVNTGRIRDNKEFRIQNSNELLIQYSAVHGLYMKLYKEQHPGHALDKNTLLDKLKRSAGYHKPISSTRFGMERSSAQSFKIPNISESFESDLNSAIGGFKE